MPTKDKVNKKGRKGALGHSKKTAVKKIAKKKDKVNTKGRKGTPGLLKKTTKKVAPKKATKKVVSKKSVKKTPKKVASKKLKKELVLSDNNKSFWVSNGQILNSLTALRDALQGMDKDIYRYHSTGWQNDFATWVEVVLNDSNCAADLHKAKTPRSARTVVIRHLKFYSI
jgi:hypothetical protein